MLDRISLELTHPWWMAALILVLPLLGWYFWRSLSDFPPRQLIVSLLTRAIVAGLLVLALATLGASGQLLRAPALSAQASVPVQVGAWSLSTVAEWRAKQESDPKAVEHAARVSMKTHVQAMVDFWNAGVPTLDYGNNIRQVAKEEGFENAFAFPGFVPAYIRPLFCRGIGPFRWCALSGDPEDIYKTDAAMKKLFPENTHLHRWLDMARERIAFQGLPARICWIGLGDRHRAGLMFNEMVASGELAEPGTAASSPPRSARSSRPSRSMSSCSSCSARRASRAASRCTSATRTRTLACTRRRWWPPATAPAATSSPASASSGRPAWTTRRPWRRCAPSPPTSAGSSTADPDP